MKNFSLWLESVFDTCSLHALTELLPLDRKVIVKALKKWGMDKEEGIKLSNLTLALDDLGVKWHIKNTKRTNGMTPIQLNQAGGFPGKHMVRGHVMPMFNGTISNFCGSGEEQIQVIITLNEDKPI